MKMKLNKIVIALSMLISFTSWAGGDVGNGGVSVICRDSLGKITSAELLDIFEGREIYGRKYLNDNISVDTKLEISQLKISRHPTYLTKFQDELAKVQANLVFIGEGIELNPTNDALPTISKNGCNYEQVANYTYEGEVLVSREIYNAFDVNNKAALFIHEAVYALRRKEGDKNSQKSRRLTAHLVANNGDQKIIDQLVSETTPSGARICGAVGSIESRISDCNFSKWNFALVARTEKGHEVYKDLHSGLIWSDRLPSTMNHNDALKVCKADLPEVGGISGLSWRLPSIEEYKDAENKWIRSALPNMNFLWWSSSFGSFVKVVGMLFNGSNGVVYYGDRDVNYSVRCVGAVGVAN
jgi:hypothetical protein